MASDEFYDNDLAYIHDTGFGDFARSAAPFVQNTAEAMVAAMPA